MAHIKLVESFYTFQTAGRIDNNKREKKLSQHGVYLCSQELLSPFDGANKEPFNQTTTGIRAIDSSPRGDTRVSGPPSALTEEGRSRSLCESGKQL